MELMTFRAGQSLFWQGWGLSCPLQDVEQHTTAVTFQSDLRHCQASVVGGGRWKSPLVEDHSQRWVSPSRSWRLYSAGKRLQETRSAARPGPVQWSRRPRERLHPPCLSREDGGKSSLAIRGEGVVTPSPSFQPKTSEMLLRVLQAPCAETRPFGTHRAGRDLPSAESGKASS